MLVKSASGYRLELPNELYETEALTQLTSAIRTLFQPHS